MKSAGWGCFDERQVRDIGHILNDITLAIEQSNCLSKRDDMISGTRFLGRGIKRLIGRIIQEHVIDSRKQSASDGNTGLLGTAPLFEDLVLGENFRMAFRAGIACGDRALKKKGLDVLAGFADTGGLLLSGAFIVLGCQTRPGAKVFGGFELLHIDADFADHANGSQGVGDTGDSKQQFDLARVRFSEFEDELTQDIPKVVKVGDVRADNLELFSLPRREGAVYSFQDFLGRSLAAFIHHGRDVEVLARMLQQLTDDGGRALSEHVTEHVIQFEVGNSEAVLDAILFSSGNPDELLVVTAQVPQLTDILRRDEAAAYQIVFEKVSDPHGVLLVRFLALDGFDEFRMSDDDMEILFKDVVDRKPILSGGFHANVEALVFFKPGCEFAQFTGIGRETLGLVFGNALAVRGCNAGNDEIAVYIHTATDRENDLESPHKNPPFVDIWRDRH